MKKIALVTGGIALATLLGTLSVQAQPRRMRGDENALQVRIGQFMPQGGNDLWDDNEDAFTLDVSDFNDAVLGFSYVSSVSNLFEVGVNVDFFDSSEVSDYRFYPDFLFDDEIPLFHETRLETMPLTVDFRFLPGGRYRMRAGGRNVRKPVFYLGAGAGLTFWEYEEAGEFIDFVDELPFVGRFKDDGSALETHVLAGVEVPIRPRFNLLFEGRHSWSSDELSDDFEGLGDIELGGTSIYFGGSFRF